MEIKDYESIPESDLHSLTIERIGNSNLFNITTRFKGDNANKTIEIDLESVMLDDTNIKFKTKTKTTKEDHTILHLNELNVYINFTGEAVLTRNNKEYGTIKEIVNCK